VYIPPPSFRRRDPAHGRLTLPWLERVPTFKDQQQQLEDKDLNTYGFLGYPLLQTADIIIYRASFVPVGEDQASHLELSREIVASPYFSHCEQRPSGQASSDAAHNPILSMIEELRSRLHHLEEKK
jgi:tryptophanyl-tRNA synthetase